MINLLDSMGRRVSVWGDAIEVLTEDSSGQAIIKTPHYQITLTDTFNEVQEKIEEDIIDFFSEDGNDEETL